MQGCLEDDAVRGVRYFTGIGHLRNYEPAVRLVLVQRPGDSPMVLASSLIDTAWQEIFRLYERRFQVEVLHRDLKQYLGLTDFRSRDLVRIRAHMSLVYLRYLLVEMVRVSFPEIGDLGFSEIKQRVVERVQELSVIRGRMRILLPPGNTLFRRLLIRYKTRLHPIGP